MTIERQCVVCKEMRQIHCTPDQLLAWQSGTLIQVAMPATPAEERELLLSGICGKCWLREDDA